MTIDICIMLRSGVIVVCLQMYDTKMAVNIVNMGLVKVDLNCRGGYHELKSDND